MPSVFPEPVGKGSTTEVLNGLSLALLMISSLDVFSRTDQASFRAGVAGMLPSESSDQC